MSHESRVARVPSIKESILLIHVFLNANKELRAQWTICFNLLLIELVSEEAKEARVRKKLSNLQRGVPLLARVALLVLRQSQRAFIFISTPSATPPRATSFAKSVALEAIMGSPYAASWLLGDCDWSEGGRAELEHLSARRCLRAAFAQNLERVEGRRTRPII